MNTQEINAANGITMEVPYKCFQTPAVFWNLIKRNILVGIPTKHLVFDQEAAVATLTSVISILNNFTDRATFNAQGLLKDDVEPSDDVYQQWTKSLKFYLTITEAEEFGLIFSIGIQESNPWTGVGIQEVGTFTAWLYMDKTGKYFFTPSPDASLGVVDLDETYTAVGVTPFAFWNSGGDLAPGMIPSMMQEEDLRDQIKSFMGEIGEKVKVLDSSIATEMKIKYTKDAMESQLHSFAKWSGGDLFMSNASLYAKKIPYAIVVESGFQSGFRIRIGMTARGNFELNYYAPVITVTLKRHD